MTDLLIVESPAKAKTIKKYLGDAFEVVSSLGHIRDLPTKSLGVDIEDDFAPTYETIQGKEKTIAALKKAAKNKERVFLGSDPDREGEAIAWHIADSLGQKGHNFKRVLFHELTPAAIKKALQEPTDISLCRFESQQTRRVLDRLVGYLVSPILWQKLKRGLSAGRVQSVALRLIVERERAVFAFRSEEYWTLDALFQRPEGEFAATLSKIGERKASLPDGESARAIVADLAGAEFTVSSVVSKEKKKNPLPPFTTSTLQQAAYNRHGFASSRTMRLAQELYEGLDLPEGSVGLITYMRTDSVRVGAAASAEALDLIRGQYGPEFAPEKPNAYRNKKGAQDAHEAIRPTSLARTPEKLAGLLSPDLLSLYSLVWSRFVASQMTPAVYHQTGVDLTAKGYSFRATGSTVKFKGFLAAYQSFGDQDDKNILPPLAEGESLAPRELRPAQHFTQPPARFNEATLVKELEVRGVGRPSTYASIITTLKGKNYVEAQKGQLRPTEMGLVVSDLLVENFPRLLDVDFTALMEENLDQIEEGSADRLEILRQHYAPLKDSLASAKANMRNVKVEGIPVEAACPKCGQSGDMSIRYGRNGFYLSCAACGGTCDFARDENGVPTPVKDPELKEEVNCELCGKPMVLKKGRFGMFLACSGYPACKNTKKIKVENGAAETLPDAPPPPLPEGVSPVCPICQSPMVPKLASKGDWFLGCSRYPKCKSTTPFPTEFPCPAPGCQGTLSSRATKRGSFYGCSKYPACRFISRAEILREPCPECAWPYQFSSTLKDQTVKISCPNPACPSRANDPAPPPKGRRAASKRPANAPPEEPAAETPAGPEKPAATPPPAGPAPEKTAGPAPRKPAAPRARARAARIPAKPAAKTPAKATRATSPPPPGPIIVKARGPQSVAAAAPAPAENAPSVRRRDAASKKGA
ncbi:MAG: type I DNA topoisomerase [Deltaproteobacteria bacterium]|jgi:DNA topoisomerase-1|nr:type I DNA topoisomerase [Deltaproteobacteria bacterium]